MAAEGALSLDWILFWTIAGGLVTAGLTTWLTAFFSFRANVRQQVWQTVYEQKRKEIQSFSETLAEYSTILNDFRGIEEALKMGIDGISHTIFLLKSCRSAEAAQHLDILNKSNRRNLQTELMDARTFLRRYNGVLLHEKFGNLRNHVQRLTLLCYDPRVVEKIEEEARNYLNEIAAGKANQERMEEILNGFKISIRFVLFRLRQDLDCSADSLKRAIRHSEAWAQSKEPSIE